MTLHGRMQRMVTDWIQRYRQRRSARKAIGRAFAAFDRTYPEWTAALFDLHVIVQTVAPWLMTPLSATEGRTPEVLASGCHDVLGPGGTPAAQRLHRRAARRHHRQARQLCICAQRRHAEHGASPICAPEQSSRALLPANSTTPTADGCVTSVKRRGPSFSLSVSQVSPSRLPNNVSVPFPPDRPPSAHVVCHGSPGIPHHLYA